MRRPRGLAIATALRVVMAASRVARFAAVKLARVEITLLAGVGRHCAACGEPTPRTMCSPCTDWIYGEPWGPS